MTEYRLAFEAISHLPIDQLSKKFYDVFDGTLVERAGQVIVTVYANGSSAVDAAHSAIAQLENKLGFGFSICRVDQDLVDGPEISSRLGVSRQTVQNWATGRRGSGFPRPIGSPGGKRIWTWGEIVEWAREHQGASEEPGLNHDEAAFVDAYLAERRRRLSSPTWPVQQGSSKLQAGTGGSDDYSLASLKVHTAL